MVDTVTDDSPVSPLQDLLNPYKTAIDALNAGAGRGTGAIIPVDDLSELDAVDTAAVGDIAYMTTPGTGITAMYWEAFGGSGSGVDWRPIGAVIAATKANLDSFISAVAAITDTRFVLGGIGYVTATRFVYKITSTAGALDLQPARIIPSTVQSGTDIGNGVVTSSAVTTCRLRTVFPSDFTVFRVEFDVTTSAAAGLHVKLAVDGTDASTAYDNQRHTAISTTSAAVQSLNATEGQAGPIGVAGARHFGAFIITDANIAGPTYIQSAATVAPPAAMTTSTGLEVVGIMHRTSTAYNSLAFTAASGNVTLNRVTVSGVS